MSGLQPAPRNHNPGMGERARLAFANGTKTWVEEVNLIEVAARALEARSHVVTRDKTWLEHPESGFVLVPQIVGVQPLEKGGIRTVTTIQIHHHSLVPDGVFEYQHSTGDSAEDSILQGFDQWVQTDFATLLEALRVRPELCTTLEWTFAATSDKPIRHRRAILGPTTHLRARPPESRSLDGTTGPHESGAADDDHSFCPCCLLTNTFKAFKDLVEDDAFFCLRLFALRDEDGSPQADCRVNGEDCEAGAKALREYASTWPDAGFEFRKQYVVLQTIDRPLGHDEPAPSC